ncbi:MAG: putative Ig domain-containing protein [Verrucomicrobia bacterium]|nr:putative Ig domain-containing protein [Verrucomicrobiota bacterium]
MKLARFYPLLLTVLLQVMPLARVVLTDPLPAAPGASILFKWAVGAFALLGFHAVAGASVTIVSSTNAIGTNGVPFSYRAFIDRGDLAPSSWSAAPLPSGLTMNPSTGRITGTPTNFIGTMPATLTAKYDGNGAEISTDLFITILASPPSFTQQPASRTNFVGGTVSFTTAATVGSAYLWRYSPPGSTNLTDLPTAQSATLVFTNLTTNLAGTYRVLAYNDTGETSSAPATLAVVPRPALQSLGVQGANTLMSLPVVPNLAYAIESATSAAGPWTTLTNLPPVAAATNLAFPDSITTGAARFYRVRSP